MSIINQDYLHPMIKIVDMQTETILCTSVTTQSDNINDWENGGVDDLNAIN